MKREGSPPISRDIILTSGAENVSFSVKELRLEDVPEGVFSAEVATLAEGCQFAQSCYFAAQCAACSAGRAHQA